MEVKVEFGATNLCAFRFLDHVNTIVSSFSGPNKSSALSWREFAAKIMIII